MKLLFIKEEIMDAEKICSTACYIAGIVFLVIALLGAWFHFFTMSLCFATGLLISEDTKSATD